MTDTRRHHYASILLQVNDVDSSSKRQSWRSCWRPKVRYFQSFPNPEWRNSFFRRLIIRDTWWKRSSSSYFETINLTNSRSTDRYVTKWRIWNVILFDKRYWRFVTAFVFLIRQFLRESFDSLTVLYSSYVVSFRNSVSTRTQASNSEQRTYISSFSRNIHTVTFSWKTRILIQTNESTFIEVYISRKSMIHTSRNNNSQKIVKKRPPLMRISRTSYILTDPLHTYLKNKTSDTRKRSRKVTRTSQKTWWQEWRQYVKTDFLKSSPRSSVMIRSYFYVSILISKCKISNFWQIDSIMWHLLLDESRNIFLEIQDVDMITTSVVDRGSAQSYHIFLMTKERNREMSMWKNIWFRSDMCSKKYDH